MQRSFRHIEYRLEELFNKIAIDENKINQIVEVKIQEQQLSSLQNEVMA